MVGAEAGVALLVLVFGLGAPLVLYALVRADHDDREVMGRAAAERSARRDVENGDSR